MWGSHLNGKNAAEASNKLSASLLRYSYPVLRWTQSELPKQDRMVRKIMRKDQCHHYNSAIERVNLLHSQGGRGLCSFPLDHDRAVLNLANTSTLQMIHSQLLWLNTKSGWRAQSRGELS